MSISFFRLYFYFNFFLSLLPTILYGIYKIGKQHYRKHTNYQQTSYFKPKTQCFAFDSVILLNSQMIYTQRFVDVFESMNNLLLTITTNNNNSKKDQNIWINWQNRKYMQADTQRVWNMKLKLHLWIMFEFIYSIESIYFTKRAISYILTLHFCLSSTLLFSLIFVYDKKMNEKIHQTNNIISFFFHLKLNWNLFCVS